MKIIHTTVPTLFLFAFIIFTNQANAAVPTVTEAQYYNVATVEARVRDAFKDVPQMIEIARCESKFRQYTDSGNPLRGPGGMVGVFQFYESIHTPGARALGYDLTTVEGNLGYARHVYNTQGLTPWNSSRYCWDVPTVTPTKTTVAQVAVPLATTPQVITTTKTRAQLQAQILTLTKLITLLQKQLAAKQGRLLS